MFASLLRTAYRCPMGTKQDAAVPARAATPQRAGRKVQVGDIEVEFDPAEVRTSYRRYPDRNGPWMLCMYFQDVDGRPECVGLKLTSMATAEENREVPTPLQMPEMGIPLTPGLIRELKLGERIRDARTSLDFTLGGAPPAAVRPPGMRESTYRRLQEAADVYRAAFAAGGKPTTAVAEHFRLTVGGASNLVSRARELGLLPPTSQGASHG